MHQIQMKEEMPGAMPDICPNIKLPSSQEVVVQALNPIT